MSNVKYSEKDSKLNKELSSELRHSMNFLGIVLLLIKSSDPIFMAIQICIIFALCFLNCMTLKVFGEKLDEMNKKYKSKEIDKAFGEKL